MKLKYVDNHDDEFYFKVKNKIDILRTLNKGGPTKRGHENVIKLLDAVFFVSDTATPELQDKILMVFPHVECTSYEEHYRS